MPDLSVLDSTIHYQDSGTGVPHVFLHGSPASSYMWRNVLPHVGNGRLLAPDMIGFGASGKPDIAYNFADQASYLDAWSDSLELDGVILVGHDWGGALALDWAARHPERVAGVAFLETFVKPMEWEDFAPDVRARSEALLGPRGEQMILDGDGFIRNAYTGGVITPVTPEVLDVYLTPFPTPESRRPILALARQRPIGGKPAELVARIDAYDAWLATSENVPKLLMTFQGQGLLIDDRLIHWSKNHIAALDTVSCGKAGHHATEDRPQEIATAIKAWVDHHQLRD
jgi:haloalkane dehalogenase